MKKIAIAILAFLLSTQVVFAEGENIVIDTKTANPGDTVEIVVQMQDNPGLIAALFSLSYDTDRLKLIGAADGRLLQGGTFSPDCEAYPYMMVWNSAATTNFTENGKLVTLMFEVLDTASAGDAFIRLSYQDEDVFDVDLNNVALSIAEGKITVTGAENGKENINTESTAGEENTNSTGTTRPSGHSGSLPSLPTSATPMEDDISLRQMILRIGEKEAFVFGEIKENDVAPILRNDRTMLPARFVAENLGAKVDWKETGVDSGVVTITKGDTTIILEIDSATAYVNTEPVTLDSPAFIENDRTYTPLRFIAEKLGAKVDWIDETQSAVITKGDGR